MPYRFTLFSLAMLLPGTVLAQSANPTPSGAWTQPQTDTTQQAWQAAPAQAGVTQQQQIINEMRAGTYQPHSALNNTMTGQQ